MKRVVHQRGAKPGDLGMAEEHELREDLALEKEGGFNLALVVGELREVYGGREIPLAEVCMGE